MAVRIKPKRGTGAPPAGTGANQVDANEIAMDMANGKLYVNNGGSVVVLAERNAAADDTYNDADARAAISVGSEGTPSGNGDVSYNNSTGVITYTPPVLTSLTGDTDSIAEGSTNLYYTNARADARVDAGFTAKDTDNLSEGSTNLYYTDARAQAVSINNLSEDSTPQLGGNLDLNSNNIDGTGNIDITGALTLSGDITGDSGDMNIINTVDGSDIVFKIDDTSGTTKTAAKFTEDDYTDDGVTKYKSFLQIEDGGIKIGSQGEFSTTGDTPNNENQDYEFNGIVINPTGNSWPGITINSTGQSAGQNPLNDRFGGAVPSLVEYPNGLLAFGAANGLVGSEQALESGKVVGSVGFLVHDGTQYGGSNSRGSAAINVSSIETASSSNDRAVQMDFEFMPAGGDGTATGRTTVVEMKESSVCIKPKGTYAMEFDQGGVMPFRLFNVESGTSDPGSPSTGEWFFNETDADLKRYNGSSWDTYNNEGYMFYDDTQNYIVVRISGDWKPITMGAAI